MRTNLCALARLGLVVLAGGVALASDFDQLVPVLKKVWPDKTVLAVVGEVSSSKPKIDALAAAVGGGLKIVVVDVRGPQDLGKALSALAAQKPQVLVLIPGDRLTGDGQPGATFLIQRLASQRIPAIATTEAAVKQGAVFAVGSGTGGKLLVNPKSATVAGVSVPEGGTPVS